MPPFVGTFYAGWAGTFERHYAMLYDIPIATRKKYTGRSARPKLTEQAMHSPDLAINNYALPEVQWWNAVAANLDLAARHQCSGSQARLMHHAKRCQALALKQPRGVYVLITTAQTAAWQQALGSILDLPHGELSRTCALANNNMHIALAASARQSIKKDYTAWLTSTASAKLGRLHLHCKPRPRHDADAYRNARTSNDPAEFMQDQRATWATKLHEPLFDATELHRLLGEARVLAKGAAPLEYIAISHRNTKLSLRDRNTGNGVDVAGPH